MMTTQIFTPEEKTQERRAIAKEFQWNVEVLYSSWEDWVLDLDKWGRGESDPRWPELLPFRKSWKESPEHLKALIELCLEIERNLSKLYTYAHLRHDEDT